MIIIIIFIKIIMIHPDNIWRSHIYTHHMDARLRQDNSGKCHSRSESVPPRWGFHGKYGSGWLTQRSPAEPRSRGLISSPTIPPPPGFHKKPTFYFHAQVRQIWNDSPRCFICSVSMVTAHGWAGQARPANQHGDAAPVWQENRGRGWGTEANIGATSTQSSVRQGLASSLISHASCTMYITGTKGVHFNTPHGQDWNSRTKI